MVQLLPVLVPVPYQKSPLSSISLLYATLAGMVVYFPMLFRMKFRFTNQQLLVYGDYFIWG